MSSVTYLTLPTGDRSHDEIEESLLQIAEKVGEEKPRDERWLSHRGDSVVIAAREFDHEANIRNIDVLADVPIKRVVLTSYDDTTESGSGVVFEHVGDTFVKIDEYHGEVFASTKVPDFFRLNYGIDPEYGYFSPDSFGPTEREDARHDWPTVLKHDESELPVTESEFATWFDSEMVETSETVEFPDVDFCDVEFAEREEKFPVGIEGVERLLDTDTYYHSAGALLNQMVDSVPETVYDQLTSEDPAVRRRTVRYVAAVDEVDPSRYDEFVRALQTVDDETRLLVAPKLWATYPHEDDTVPGPDCIEPLLDLVDDPIPEVRLAGVVGAGDVIGRLLRDIESGEMARSVLYGVGKPFHEAYLSLLEDDDTRVREVACRLVTVEFYREYGHVFDGILTDGLDFDLRWAVATAHTAVSGAEDPAQIEHPMADNVLWTVFGGEDGRMEDFGSTQADEYDTKAIARMIEYAYGADRSGQTAVRGGLADLAFVRPHDVREAVREAASVVEAGTETVADVRLLATAADALPEEVSRVEAELRDIVTETPEDDHAVFADYALARLPDCDHDLRVGTDNGSDGIEGEYGKLDERRVQLLVDTAPTRATRFLETLPNRIETESGEPEYRRSNVAEAVHAASTADSQVVADAFGALSELLTEPSEIEYSFAEAVLRVAEIDPRTVEGAILGHYDSVEAFVSEVDYSISTEIADALDR